MKISVEIVVHLLFWLLYIINSMIFYESEYVRRGGTLSIEEKQLAIFIIIIVIFYINYIILIPKYLSQRKYLKYLSGIFSLIAGASLFYMIWARFLDWISKSGDAVFNDRLMTIPFLVFQIAFYLLLSSGAKFSMDWFKNLKLKDELEKEKTESEIKLLKSQISPHFLFNTLNNLYSLVQRKSEEAPNAVLMLSDLMRYMLKESSKEKIELVKEISYVKSFIELQRLRLSRPDIVRSQILIDNATVQISPMLLIPFVENTFKHADITSDDAIIEFKLELKQDILFFTVDNNIKERNKDETTGVGLVNVRRRLDLLYPNKYKLNIENNSNKFHVTLELNLNDN